MRTLGIALLVSLTAVGVADTAHLSPLSTGNQRAIVLPFLRFEPRGTVLTQGDRAFSVHLSAANDLRQMSQGPDLYLSEDHETQRLGLAYQAGIGNGVDWSVRVPVLFRNGGFLDPLIEWWHENIIGVRNFRSDVPYGRSEVIVPGSPRFGSAGGLGDISFSLSKQISPRLVGTVGLKLPTGDASKLLGSGAVDGGASLDYRLAWGPRTAVFAQAALVGQGKATQLESARGLVHQEALAVAYATNSRDSWVLQWQSEASPLTTGIAGSDSTHRILSLGFCRQLSDRQTLQLFFTEDGDWENYRVSEVANLGPDFTVGVSLTTRF